MSQKFKQVMYCVKNQLIMYTQMNKLIKSSYIQIFYKFPPYKHKYLWKLEENQ